MPSLKCPGCSAKGAANDDQVFEPRGRSPYSDYRWPMVKCLKCGRGLIVKPRAVPPGAKATLVPPADWEKMEKRWAEFLEEEKRRFGTPE